MVGKLEQMFNNGDAGTRGINHKWPQQIRDSGVTSVWGRFGAEDQEN